jgi:hypothetical protein
MDILFIVLLALIFASVLIGPVGWRHSRTPSAAGAWIFALLVLLLLMWLALVWIPPAGPVVLGVYWLGPLVVGLLLVFLLAAAAPPPRRLRKGEEPKAGQDQLGGAGTTAVFIDAMFWLFLLGAVALLTLGLLT